MLLSDFIKLCAVAFLLCSSCSVRQTAENNNSIPHVIEEAETGIPFQNREPETFQTEIVVTNFYGGESKEKRYFLARSGERRLMIFNRGEAGETSVLQTADGKKFAIDKAKKIYTERQIQTGQTGSELIDFLTTEWLNQKNDAVFENLGMENDLTKYRVRFNGSNASEIFVFIDGKLNLPVKQEFYSVSGEQKNLTLLVEMKNFLPSADENLFELPQDYKRAENK